jgi:hypothetical protein
MTDLDLEQSLYEESFRSLGYSKNGDAMKQLAVSVPLRVLRQLGDPLDAEALLLGCSGLLPATHLLDGSDRGTCDYVDELWFRFRSIRTGFDVSQMSRESWLFARLRPRNFPPLRIAQGAQWVSKCGWLMAHPMDHLYEALLSTDPAPELMRLLTSTPGPFWTAHARLERRLASDQNPSLGRTRIVDTLVNVVLPFTWAWAEQSERAHVQNAVFLVLDRLPASSDSIEARFVSPKGVRRNAVYSQGLHHLYREWCLKGGCTRCAVGLHILKNGGLQTDDGKSGSHTRTDSSPHDSA